MRLLFVASMAAALCSCVAAQTQVTCPAGFNNAEGGHLTGYLGRYAEGRFQFADGGCRGKPININQVDYRLDLQFYSTSQSEGGGRSWTNVTLSLALTDLAKMSQTFSANIIGTAQQVFSNKVSWKTSTGNPFTGNPKLAKWGDVASFPFSQPYFYIANQDLLFDYSFAGGTLANSMSWTGSQSRTYIFDGLAGNDLDFARNRGLGWGNFTKCGDSNQGNFAWAAIELDVYSTNPPNPSKVHQDYAGRGNQTFGQLKGMFDIEVGSQRTAMNANVIHAMGVVGTLVGTNIGAKCNLLYIDITQPWIPVVRKADANGEVGLFSASVRSTLLGPVKYDTTFAGFRIWAQAAWADSRTNEFALSTARFSDMPNQPGAVAKKMCYHYVGNSKTAFSPPSIDSFRQTLPLLTLK